MAGRTTTAKTPVRKPRNAKMSEKKPSTKASKSAAKTSAKDISPTERLDAIGIDAICEYMCEPPTGNSLLSFCISSKFSHSTVNDWIAASDERSVKYARAKETRADCVFESLDTVSDLAASSDSPVEVAGLRLKSDNIKWKLARMHRKFSDRQILAGDPDAPLNAAPKADLSKLTDKELQVYLAMQRKLEGRS